MKYLKIDSVEEAKLISAGFYELVRPILTRAPKDTTNFYYGYIIHPVNGSVCLEINENDEINVHEKVDLISFISIFPIEIKERILLFSHLAEALTLTRKINVIEFLPELFKNKLLDVEVLENEGWFEYEEENI